MPFFPLKNSWGSAKRESTATNKHQLKSKQQQWLKISKSFVPVLKVLYVDEMQGVVWRFANNVCNPVKDIGRITLQKK